MTQIITRSLPYITSYWPSPRLTRPVYHARHISPGQLWLFHIITVLCVLSSGASALRGCSQFRLNAPNDDSYGDSGDVNE